MTRTIRVVTLAVFMLALLLALSATRTVRYPISIRDVAQHAASESAHTALSAKLEITQRQIERDRRDLARIESLRDDIRGHVFNLVKMRAQLARDLADAHSMAERRRHAANVATISTFVHRRFVPTRHADRNALKLLALRTHITQVETALSRLTAGLPDLDGRLARAQETIGARQRELDLKKEELNGRHASSRLLRQLRILETRLWNK